MSDLNIDKSKTALVVIDLQNGIVGMSKGMAKETADSVVSNSSKLADAFRKHHMPVFLVHVHASKDTALKPLADNSMQMGTPPADWADIIPEMGPKENDVVILKQQWGAFYGTELELQLRRRKVDTIVLCGISTNIGVESTARFAFEYGYQQIFAEDAMMAFSTEEHDNSINHILKRIGRVRKTSEIVEALK